jgi:uncharacterized protein YxeA
MKKPLFLLVCLLFLTGCLKESQTQFSIGEDQVFLVITPNTTKEELAQIAIEFKEKKNIDIDYSKSTFSADGKISEVNLVVDCNDGFKGSTHCSATALTFKNIGFSRDYSTESMNVFHIGAM